MSNKVVQITFTASEYQHLKRKAENEGITVALYIKNKVLDDTEFQQRFSELIEKANRITPGTEFNIKAVFGTDWNGISRGLRLALGRAFFNYVNAGKIDHIDVMQKDSAHTQWYKKQ